MTRRLVLAATLALALAPQTFANGWLKTVAAAEKAAKQKNQLILVDMFADWCGWCHRFEREVFPSAVFQEATKDIVLLRLNTEDRGEGSQMAQKYGVTSLPTFLLLAPDMSVAGMIRGYMPPNDFVSALNQSRSNYDAFQKRVKNEANLDAIQKLALAKEFITRGAFGQAEPRLRKLATTKGVPLAVRDEAYYELAVMQVMQKKFDDGLKTIAQLKGLSKAGLAVERARLLAAQVHMQAGNLPAAAAELRSLKQTFPNSTLIPNVDMMLPEIERRLASAK